MNTKWLNWPNAITIVRLFLIPVFVAVFFMPFDSELKRNWVAFGVLAFSGFTDVLDGYLARKLNQITTLGKLLDPIADKLMQVSVFFCLFKAEVIPPWVLIVYACKELLMLVGGKIILSRGLVIQANRFGKTATLLFYVAAGLIFLFPIPKTVGFWLILISLIATLISLVQYAVIAFNQWNAAGSKSASQKE